MAAPQKGLIGPVEFIEVIDSSDLMSKINNWVLDEGVKNSIDGLKVAIK